MWMSSCFVLGSRRSATRFPHRAHPFRLSLPPPLLVGEEVRGVRSGEVTSSRDQFERLRQFHQRGKRLHGVLNMGSVASCARSCSRAQREP